MSASEIEALRRAIAEATRILSSGIRFERVVDSGTLSVLAGAASCWLDELASEQRSREEDAR